MAKETTKVWVVKMLRDNEEVAEENGVEGDEIPEEILIYETIGVFSTKSLAVKYIRKFDPEWVADEKKSFGVDSYKSFELEEFIMNCPDADVE